MSLTRRVLSPARHLLRRVGIDIIRYDPRPAGWSTISGSDLDDEGQRIRELAVPYTMTSRERLTYLIDAVRYASRTGIQGAVVECGVWRGGSMLAAALTLASERDFSRDLYLFDTFSGMPAATDIDVRLATGERGEDLRRLRNPRGRTGSDWACVGLAEVKHVMRLSQYPEERIHFIEGLVELTVPELAPERISVLRLDTDFYTSTKHELEHLVQRVSPHGIVILDDYGDWDGARKATDEFVAAAPVPLLLARIDWSGRAFIVPSELSQWRDGIGR